MRRGSFRWMWVAGALIVVSACAAWAQDDELPFDVPQYPIPEDNAWDYMKHAAEVARQWKADTGWRVMDTADRDGTTPDYAKAMEWYWHALEILREGLYLPCRLPDVEPGQLDWEHGSEVHAGLRSVARGLVIEAQARVQQGKREEAIGSAQDCLRLGRNLTINGLVMDQLVAWSISAMGAGTLDRVLNACRPSAERLIEFANWNEQNRAEMQSLADTLALETKLKLAMMRQVTPEQYAAYMVEVIEWAGQPAHIRGPTPEAPWEAASFSLINEGTWARAAEKKLMNDASLAGISIRCALEAHREREGRCPRTLAALSPDYLAEVPVDPCSGKDFVYVLRRLDGTGGYELYSVGPDGDDDGGQLVWSGSDENGDLLIAPEWNIYTSRGEPQREMRAMPPGVEMPVEEPPLPEEAAPGA